MMKTLDKNHVATFSKLIKDEDIRHFAELSHDKNPLHLDETFAKTTIFGERIAHGMYVSSFISAVIANDFPGPGSIYLSQELSFKRPVFIGDTVTVSVKYLETLKPTLYKLSTVVTNQEGKTVIEGTALIKNSEVSL